MNWIGTSDQTPIPGQFVLGWWDAMPDGEPSMVYLTTVRLKDGGGKDVWYQKVLPQRRCAPPSHWMPIEGPVGV